MESASSVTLAEVLNGTEALHVGEAASLVSAELDALTLRGLSRNGAQRFESARLFALQLEAVVRPAMAAEISEWVRSIAGPALATRSEKLARMERQASALDDAQPSA